MSKSSPYGQRFFEAQVQSTDTGHLKLIERLQAVFAPRSVVDVGCGVGHWLSSWEKAGIADVTGVDGDWVPRSLLQIPAERFTAMNLSRPQRLERTFDLVLSLEVAEHIAPVHARDFVRFLTLSGPVVCFSAAPPNQGGEDHLNEQPPHYWRDLFGEFDFTGFDWLRPALWDESALAYCYRQNVLLFVNSGAPDLLARAAARSAQADFGFRHLAHPDNLASKVPRLDLRNRGVRPLVGALPAALWKAFSQRSGVVDSHKK
jgi:SAM-dependent methyltransferase